MKKLTGYRPPQHRLVRNKTATLNQPISEQMSNMTATSFVGASYPDDLVWYPVPSATDSEDPAALTQYRILPMKLNARPVHLNATRPATKEALLIELQYRHGTVGRRLILKSRFRGASSIDKKGRHEVAINYLPSDDPTQRELTEHIYFETPLDALDFQVRLTEAL